MHDPLCPPYPKAFQLSEQGPFKTLAFKNTIVPHSSCFHSPRPNPMHSHTCNAKTTTHITDIFFFEEFTKLIGYDASCEWLKTSSTKRRKSTLCSSSSLSTQSSKHSTPQHSAATTPRRFSLIQSWLLHQNADPQETSLNSRKSEGIEQMAEARQNPTKPTDESGAPEDTRLQKRDFPDSCLKFSQQNLHSPRRNSASSTAESVTGRIGLLYTDAAHSVLEDRDVAQYIEHAIDFPFP